MLCRGLEKNGMVGAWHGHGMASVNQARPHCVNQMGKTHSEPLVAWHDGNGMLCVNWPLLFHCHGCSQVKVVPRCCLECQCSESCYMQHLVIWKALLTGISLTDPLYFTVPSTSSGHHTFQDFGHGLLVSCWFFVR